MHITNPQSEAKHLVELQLDSLFSAALNYPMTSCSEEVSNLPHNLQSLSFPSLLPTVC